MPQVLSEPAQNISSDFFEWSCAVITNTMVVWSGYVRKICFCVFLVYPEYLLNAQAAGTKKKDARSKKINGVFA